MGSPIETKIENLQITALREIADERGSVLHFVRADDVEFQNFGEVYFSEVRPGVAKGWKLHYRKTQFFAVPAGRIQLVIFDDRNGSSSRGVVQCLELGRPDSYLRVRIPPRVWYGFGCLGSTPALLANCCDLPHDPQESRTVPLDDPSIPYDWDVARGVSN